MLEIGMTGGAVKGEVWSPDRTRCTMRAPTARDKALKRLYEEGIEKAVPPETVDKLRNLRKALKREQNPGRLAGTDGELIAERRRLVPRSE